LQDFGETKDIAHMTEPLSGSYMYETTGVDTHYYTDGDQNLSWTPEGSTIDVSFTFDITLTGGTPKAADGSGTFHAGVLAVTFLVNDVQLDTDSKPVAGSMLVTSGRFAATVVFGVNTATVQIGTVSWTVNMATGLVS
jgi:hypothetical protein